jgi:hypothetical protein
MVDLLAFGKNYLPVGTLLNPKGDSYPKGDSLRIPSGCVIRTLMILVRQISHVETRRQCLDSRVETAVLCQPLHKPRNF